jgi:hypothetical protein
MSSPGSDFDLATPLASLTSPSDRSASKHPDDPKLEVVRHFDPRIKEQEYQVKVAALVDGLPSN